MSRQPRIAESHNNRSDSINSEPNCPWLRHIYDIIYLDKSHELVTDTLYTFIKAMFLLTQLHLFLVLMPFAWPQSH